MMTKDHFFNDTLLDIQLDSEDKKNTLLSCLHTIVNKMKLTVDDWSKIKNINTDNMNDFSQILGVMFYSVSIKELVSIKNLEYPLLMQLKDEFHILTKNKLASLADTVHIKVWQCVPINFPLSAKYTAIIRSVIKVFSKEILFVGFLGLLLSSTTLLISMLSGYLFSHVDEIQINKMWPVVVACMLFFLCSSVLSYVSDQYIRYLNNKFLFNLMPSLWHRFFNLSVKFLKNVQSGCVSQKINDFEIANSTIITVSFSLFIHVVSLIALLIYMAFFHLAAVFFYFLIAIFFVFLKFLLMPGNIKYMKAQLTEQGKLTSLLHDLLWQIDKIRAASIEHIVYKRWLRGLIQVKSYLDKSSKLEILNWAIESMFPIFLLIGFYLILYFSQQREGNNGLLQFMICAGQFVLIFNKMLADMVSLFHLIPSLQAIQLLLHEPIIVPNNHYYDHSFRGNIKLKNVYLQDATSNKPILENVSIELQAGKYTALIGKSGAGKSSLFQLLLGFDKMHSGSLLIDDVDANNINMKNVRAHFGVVLQNSSILPGSIFSNIAAHNSITLEDAWRLASYVGLDDEINHMPMKMYTQISDNAGESISGGQKQKILIARALANSPQLLLFDEATSALDNDSQDIIFKNLAKLNITRFVIAHRYSTIKNADWIYVLDEGRVIKEGTYADIFRRTKFAQR